MRGKAISVFALLRIIIIAYFYQTLQRSDCSLSQLTHFSG